MRDREVILDVLRRVARRLWVKSALQEFGFSLSVILFSVVAFQLVWPESGVALGPLSRATLGLVATGGVAFVLWRARGLATLARAAGAADRSGRLNDELKTAYWLVTHEEASAIGELQVERAARTARRLDPRRIVPAQPPTGLWVAGVLVLVLAVTSSLAPRLSLSWDSMPPETRDTPASLRSLLEDAQNDERLQRLDQALATLERPELSAEQWQQALTQARDAVDEANLRAIAARESLSRAVSIMRGRAESEQAAKALEEGRTREAIELLKRLAAERAGQPHGAESGGSLQAKGGEAQTRSGDDVHRQAARVNEDALSRVMKSIEAAHEALDSQRRANEVRRRMEDFLVATSQRSALTASQFGTRAGAPNPTSAPQTGEADLRGGTMYRQGAVARDRDDTQEGGRPGAATGHTEALELEGASTQRLDARLKVEALQAGSASDDSDEHKGQDTWYYQPTRGGEATTTFASLPGAERFMDARAMNPERVTLHDRQSVKDYFIKLHESATK